MPMRPFVWRTANVASVIAAIALFASPTFAQTPVLTQHDDNGRSGAYAHESVLTPTNSSGGNFGKLFTRSLDANVNGQVLYVPHLTINSAVHNVIVASTSSNGNGSLSSLYCFDADDPSQSAPLWRHTFTNSAQWTTCTPAIDLSTNTVYVVTKDNNDSGATKLRALDLLTGNEKTGSPITVSATVNGTGDGSSSGHVSFDTSHANCRPALLIANNSVYIAFAHNSDSFPYHGWIFRYTYDGSTFAQANVFCVNPNGGLDGIWMAGNGLAADDSGNIYTTTGNGTFDVNTGGTSYGMSVIKLSSTLSVLDYFTPWDEAGNSNADADLGNCGVMMVPGTNRLFTGGTKFGSSFLLDSTNLGHFTSGGPDAALNRIDSSNSNVGQNPVGWDSGTYKYTYLWPSGTNIKQFRYDVGVSKLNPNAVFLSSSGITNGGSLAVSSDGTSNGILWAVGGGVVHAKPAADVSQADYWNSSTNSARDGLGSTGHFQFPTVAAGRVYVPTGSSSIVAYGLLTTTAAPQVSPASTAFQNQLQITISDSGVNLTARYYTTDGSIPYPGNGTTTLYTGPLNITSTTTVKAISVAAASEPSPVTAQTYTATTTAATHLIITAPTSVTAGAPFNFSVTAVDVHGHVVTDFGDTVRFWTNAPRATLPTQQTLTSGTGTFSATFTVAGTAAANFKISAGDTVVTSITGTSHAIVVNPAVAAHLLVTAPSSVTAGVPFNFTVTAVDSNGHIVPGYAGTVQCYTNAPRATMPANSTLTNGTKTFSATFTKVGGTSANFKVNARDTVTTSIAGTSAAIAVTP